MATIDLRKNLAELMQENPNVGEVLGELGIDCANCLAAQVDTLPDVARMYQLDLNDLLDRIQALSAADGDSA